MSAGRVGLVADVGVFVVVLIVEASTGVTVLSVAVGIFVGREEEGVEFKEEDGNGQMNDSSKIRRARRRSLRLRQRVSRALVT